MSTNKAVVEKLIWGFNERDDTAIAEAFADTIQDHPTGAREPSGVVAGERAFLSMMPDARAEIHALIEEGNSVAMRFSIHGTHSREFMGFAPTGKSVELGGMEVFRIENGRIVERWAALNIMGAFAR